MQDLLAALRATLAEYGRTRFDGLQFSRLETVWLVLAALVGLGLVLALARKARSQWGRRRGVPLPALLSWARDSRGALLRHGALTLSLAGLASFSIALADPVTALVRQEVTYPGRRISLMIDASSSMLASLPSARLAAPNAPNDAAFFTTVGAARYFLELRRKGQYRDLIALVEFGDEAYVITPFTTDYDNVLLSMSLIGDWNEFMSFPDQGTVIANAIDQSVGLFKAFDFLDASGNAMVIFSDGVDAEVTEDGKSGFDVLRDAREAEIPVFFIRVGANRESQQAVPDEVWRTAVARTGGRFYAAVDEATIVRAIQDIDRAAAGQISMRRYSSDEPRFAPFALGAAALWLAALALRLTTPFFDTLT